MDKFLGAWNRIITNNKGGQTFFAVNIYVLEKGVNNAVINVKWEKHYWLQL